MEKHEIFISKTEKGYILFMKMLFLLIVWASLLWPNPKKSRPTIFGPYSEEHVTINGYLDDWGGMSGFRMVAFADSAAGRPSRLNNEARFSVRWNDQALYLAFFVQDRNLNGSTFSDLENARQDDGVEIWLDGANDSGYRLNENDYHLVVGLHNNVNEMRGKAKKEARQEQVPRVLSRNLKVQAYVRPFGTINKNDDVDSGFSVEMAIEWKSLGVDIAKQRALRLDVGVLDLDTNAFSNPDSWTGMYYSGFMYNDRKYSRSPALWAGLLLNEPPVVAKPFEEKEGYWSSIPVRSMILFAIVLLVGGIMVVFYYLRIRRLHREMRNQILLKLQQYLEGHYKEKIALEDFSRLHNYPEGQVQRVFKSHYKNSFASVLLQKRMEEAKRLLENSDKNVTEVCFEVGFNDASYFTKSFKNFFKILPKEVKKQRPV